MRALLTCVTALAAVIASAPAQAQSRGGGNGVTVHRGGDGDHGGFRRDRHRGDFRRDGDFRSDRPDRRRDRFDDGAFYYESDFDGGSAWRADSFNDWWHDNPRRSSPRWVVDNRSCQMWWGNGGWRC